MVREIMDHMSLHSTARDICVMKPAQSGVTEAIINFICYVMDHAPAPMMILLPTLEMRDAWRSQKLNPAIMETPVINQLLGGLRGRDSANRQDLIDFPGGVLFLSGGNSPNSYAQRSVRYLVLDDLDRFPAEAGEEGDILLLSEGRTKSFHRHKRVYVSTPTLVDGLIDRKWSVSDQRHYHVPCPLCGEFQPLEWGGADESVGIKYTILDEETVAVHYRCRKCGGNIPESCKTEMLARGHWVPTHPRRSRLGYQFNSLYAPIGIGPTWAELVQAWLAAQEHTSSLRAFYNTQLGLPWEERGQSVDPLTIFARREDFRHRPQMLRIAGIDVQKDRLEMTIYDFGAGEECWAVEHVIVYGDTAGEDPWRELESYLEDLAPNFGGIDSGYNTDQVLAFARKRKWLFLLKGILGRGKPLVEPDEERSRRLRRRRRRTFAPYLVSDEAAKSLLTQRLMMPAVEGPAPGYIHFPQEVASFDEEFFAQLTSNEMRERTVKNRRIREWVETRERNEAYDCWKYAMAALRLSRVDPALFVGAKSSDVRLTGWKRGAIS